MSEPHPGRRAAIRAIYAELDAPEWAAPNLDGLADVLRDLSWRPAGPVRVTWPPRPHVNVEDAGPILAVLRAAVAETAGGTRPVTLHFTPR